MNSIIEHQPWCVDHEFREGGTSWHCSRTLYQTAGPGGVLVEVTWDPERGTRLILFADLDRSLERVEARAIAIAILAGSDQLEGGYRVDNPHRCQTCGHVWAEHGPDAPGVCTCGTLTKVCSRRRP